VQPRRLLLVVRRTVRDRRAIGSLGDNGGFGSKRGEPSSSNSALTGVAYSSKCPLCCAFGFLAEGEGFEPSTRLDDV
jgi:hypothetical protein